MRGRLYATALPAILLALLLASASAQENHQDTAGVPEGFDADAQAARDADAFGETDARLGDGDISEREKLVPRLQICARAP